MLEILEALCYVHSTRRFYCALAGNQVLVCHNEIFDTIDTHGPLEAFQRLVDLGAIILDLRILSATRYPPDPAFHYPQTIPLFVPLPGICSSLAVFCISASPDGQAKLALDDEVQRIKDRLLANPIGHKVAFTYQSHAKIAELQELLLEVKPTVVHFGGHGELGGKLMFEGPSEVAIALPGPLSQLISAICLPNLRLVFLNTCHSESLGQMLSNQVDFVVAMKAEISDVSALEFAASFYLSLAFQKSVLAAFNIAQAVLALNNRPDSQIPLLLNRIEANVNDVIL